MKKNPKTHINVLKLPIEKEEEKNQPKCTIYMIRRESTEII